MTTNRKRFAFTVNLFFLLLIMFFPMLAVVIEVKLWNDRPEPGAFDSWPDPLTEPQIQLVDLFKKQFVTSRTLNGEYSGFNSSRRWSTYTFADGVLHKRVIYPGLFLPDLSIEGSAPYRLDGSVIVLDGPVTGAQRLFYPEGEAVFALKPGEISLPNQAWVDLRQKSYSFSQGN
jgi:hypothetical protein